ncbi:MAG: hypothetical protein KIT14_25650 [bacterium]|nr:hypothetical protein [bacterium]
MQSAHRREVARSDRRWLMVWAAIFLAMFGLFAAAHGIYRATGPHPEVQVFLRRVKHHARWLIPGLKSRPNWRGGDVHLLGDHVLRHPGSAASGHDAQRGNA